jgi:hypothetical protein
MHHGNERIIKKALLVLKENLLKVKGWMNAIERSSLPHTMQSGG